jgi:hypothetical protein
MFFSILFFVGLFSAVPAAHAANFCTKGAPRVVLVETNPGVAGETVKYMIYASGTGIASYVLHSGTNDLRTGAITSGQAVKGTFASPGMGAGIGVKLLDSTGNLIHSCSTYGSLFDRAPYQTGSAISCGYHEWGTQQNKPLWWGLSYAEGVYTNCPGTTWGPKYKLVVRSSLIGIIDTEDMYQGYAYEYMGTGVYGETLEHIYTDVDYPGFPHFISGGRDTAMTAPTCTASLTATPNWTWENGQFNVGWSNTFVGKADTFGNQYTAFDWKIDGQPYLSDQSVFAYTFTTPGDHKVELTVKDIYGTACTASKTLPVILPDCTAAVQVAPYPATGQMTSNTDLHFTTTGSELNTGLQNHFAWKMDGVDFQQDWRLDNVYDKFTTAGDHTVEMTISDEYGNSCSASKTFTLKPKTCQAAFAIFPSSNKLTGKDIQFNGSSTRIDSKSPANYIWKIDGVVYRQGSSSSVVYDNFAAAGTHTAELTISDALGNSCATSQSFSVAAPLLPTTCTADFNAPSSAYYGDSVNFDPSPSSGTGEGSSTYYWYRSDGSLLGASNTVSPFPYVFTTSTASPVGVKLVVQHQSGPTCTSPVHNVTLLKHCSASFTSSCPGGVCTTSTASTFTAAQTGANSYAWYDNSNTSFAVGTKATRTFASAGTHAIRLDVDMGGGSTCTLTQNMTVNAPASCTVKPTPATTDCVYSSADSAYHCKYDTPIHFTATTVSGTPQTYAWTLDGATTLGNNPTLDHTFASKDGKQHTVSLTAADGSTVCTSSPLVLKFDRSLPVWDETVPVSMLLKSVMVMLAGFLSFRF